MAQRWLTSLPAFSNPPCTHLGWVWNGPSDTLESDWNPPKDRHWALIVYTDCCFPSCVCVCNGHVNVLKRKSIYYASLHVSTLAPSFPPRASILHTEVFWKYLSNQGNLSIQDSTFQILKFYKHMMLSGSGLRKGSARTRLQGGVLQPQMTMLSQKTTQPI